MTLSHYVKQDIDDIVPINLLTLEQKAKVTLEQVKISFDDIVSISNIITQKQAIDELQNLIDTGISSNVTRVVIELNGCVTKVLIEEFATGRLSQFI
ncbi:MAG TPA: hypothetical protein V6C58_11875 [Allocoleopsis sp.]